jgi:hypothetical protein
MEGNSIEDKAFGRKAEKKEEPEGGREEEEEGGRVSDVEP